VAPTIRRVATVAVALLSCILIAVPARAATSPPVGSWSWPIEGRVVRGFEPPPTPFSSGHRGIDIAAAFGTPVHAPADGVVSFAGFVGGELFVTIDHGDGYRSTGSWLAQALVKKGQAVREGDVVALSGRGHPELPEPQLHFGVRQGSTYLDPLSVLTAQSVMDLIRLAPLSPLPAGTPAAVEADAPARWRSAWWTFRVRAPAVQPRGGGGSVAGRAAVRGLPWVS